MVRYGNVSKLKQKRIYIDYNFIDANLIKHKERAIELLLPGLNIYCNNIPVVVNNSSAKCADE